MDLPSLLAELKPLLADHKANLPRITRLLADHRELAEYEVARFLAAQAIQPVIEEGARSVDPRERRQAVKLVADVLPRSAAAKVVRSLAKDPDTRVRSAARNAVELLGLWHEVAVRDARYAPPRFVGPFSEGGWNTTSWRFGLHRPRPPKAPPAAVAPVPIPDVAALAGLLGFATVEELTRFTRPGDGRGAPYVAFQVPKRSGGTRTLHAPRPKLKAVQRTILAKILAPLPLASPCHGFVKKHSTVTNASPHVGAAVVVKTDLRDFFPTVHFRRVQGLFSQLGYSDEVAKLLARLTTYRPKLPDGRVVWPGALPQGAPTSPAIANLVCRRLDQRLAGLAKKAGATYTRYADDLTFSFPERPANLGRFLWWVDQICGQEGFSEHTGKRRVLSRGNRQAVTGIVVNQHASVPRDLRRRLRAIIHNCRTKGLESQARGRADFEAWLRGNIAYVSMVQPEVGKALLAELEEALKAGGKS